MAVVVTNGIPFWWGWVNSPPILVYVSGDWDVTGILTHGGKQGGTHVRTYSSGWVESDVGGSIGIWTKSAASEWAR